MILENYDLIRPINKLNTEATCSDYQSEAGNLTKKDLIKTSELNDIDKMIRYFFHGKRAQERQDKLVEMIDMMIRKCFYETAKQTADDEALDKITVRLCNLIYLRDTLINSRQI